MDKQLRQPDKANPLYYKHLLESKVREMFTGESSGHDIDHLNRVFNLALHIQNKEGGDKIVIGVASYLHDIHRIKEKKTGKYIAPKDSLPDIRELLEEVDFSQEKIEMVLHCIEFHEEYGFSETGKTVKDIETFIVQDADNLDAIGAIGIGRTFAFGGANNIPMWIPDKPHDRDSYDETERDLSTIHHFYSKLLKLGDNMNTETAKQMAIERHEYMEQFVKRFIQEWNGEK